MADHGFSHTVIEVGREYELFDRLKSLERTIPGWTLSSHFARIPDGSMMGECCYGEITETPYGNPLTFVSAGEFLSVVGDDGGRQLKAAAAYLRELPPDTLIGLYYH